MEDLDVQPVVILNKKPQGPLDPGASCFLGAVGCLIVVAVIAAFVYVSFVEPWMTASEHASRLKKLYEGKPTLVFCTRAYEDSDTHGCGAIYKVQSDDLQSDWGTGKCSHCGKWVSWEWWSGRDVDFIVENAESTVRLDVDFDGLAKKKLKTLNSLQAPNLKKVETSVELEEPEDFSGREYQHFELGKPLGSIDYWWK